jgi:ElaB/YqjD/DUF883 family membrane-anchored ribosome-binding protein
MANQSGVLKDKSEQFGSDISKQMNDKKEELTNLASSTITSVKDRAGDIAGSIGDKARDLAHKAKDTATDVYDNVDTMISERPMQSFLIGLGIGALLGITVTSLLKR